MKTKIICVISMILILGYFDYSYKNKINQNDFQQNKEHIYAEIFDEESFIIFKESVILPVQKGWIIKSTQMETVMYSEEKPVLLVKKQKFNQGNIEGKDSSEIIIETIKNYCPEGVIWSEIVEREMNNVVVYEVYGSEVEIYSKEQHAFVKSDDKVYLDFIIQEEDREIYSFYFMNDMAEDGKIEEYLSKISWYQEIEDTDGKYRWMIIKNGY